MFTTMIRDLGFEYGEAVRDGDDAYAIEIYDHVVRLLPQSPVPSDAVWSAWNKGRNAANGVY